MIFEKFLSILLKRHSEGIRKESKNCIDFRRGEFRGRNFLEDEPHSEKSTVSYSWIGVSQQLDLDLNEMLPTSDQLCKSCSLQQYSYHINSKQQHESLFLQAGLDKVVDGLNERRLCAWISHQLQNFF
jgi:hypothetical protein